PLRTGRPQSPLPGRAEPGGVPRPEHRDPQLRVETGAPGVHDLLRRADPHPMTTATVTYTDGRTLPGGSVIVHPACGGHSALCPVIRFRWRSGRTTPTSWNGQAFDRVSGGVPPSTWSWTGGGRTAPSSYSPRPAAATRSFGSPHAPAGRPAPT